MSILHDKPGLGYEKRLEHHIDCTRQHELLGAGNLLKFFPLVWYGRLAKEGEVRVESVEEKDVDTSNHVALVESLCVLLVKAVDGFPVGSVDRRLERVVD